MATTLLIGTDRGLYLLDPAGSGPGRDEGLGDRAVLALGVRDGEPAAALGGGTVARRGAGGSWAETPGPAGLEAACVLPTGHGLLVGSSEAHLFRLEGRALARVEGFEGVEGRDQWYTPWGGPPAVRSIFQGPDGTLYVNVHVGGIPRSADGGTWEPTIDIDADVHQVLAHPERDGVVLAATAWGLARSDDGGRTWRFEEEGLHAGYCRAVAVAGDVLLLTASEGPRGTRAAVYRAPLRGRAARTRFERCEAGLPEWFDGNVDTGCLAAAGPLAAFGTAEGRVYVSPDGGQTWDLASEGLPPVRAAAFAVSD